MNLIVDKKDWLKKSIFLSLAATTIAWIICTVASWALPIIGIDTKGYLMAYYTWTGQNHKDLDPSPVVVVNTQELIGDSARGEVAELIDSICKAGAKAVGVDLRFPERSDANNGKLLNTLKNNKDKVVLARANYNGITRGSFFDEEDSLIFGITNLPSYTSFTPTDLETGEDLFSYRVAQIAYPEKTWNFKRFIVNYEPVAFDCYSAISVMEDSKEARGDYFHDKVVLIGDLDNEKDYHNTPFMVDGQEWTVGVLLHAYPLLSLCKDGREFKKMAAVWDFLLCLVLTFVFSFVFTYLTLLEHSFLNKSRLLYSTCLVLKPFLIAFINILLLWLCFICITRPTHLVPSAIYYMLSVVIINNKMNNYVSHIITQSADEK